MRTHCLLSVGLLMSACAERQHPQEAGAPGSGNVQQSWARLLTRAVGEDGSVNYTALQRRRAVLDRYMTWLAAHGPISDNYSYSQEDKSIAYWANAYNASVLFAVIDNEPFESVLDVKTGLYRLPQGAGFFMGQRFLLDGQWMSLYTLEHQYLLGQYEDPFIHVMLNCASKGCPPPQYWTADDLDGQVEQALRDFLASSRGLQQDDAGSWALSELFVWYEDQFVDWSTADSLCEFLAPYAPEEGRIWLEEEHDAGCTPQTFAYDWSLNGTR